jgi:hypothetical protein
MRRPGLRDDSRASQVGERRADLTDDVAHTGGEQAQSDEVARLPEPGLGLIRCVLFF